MRYLLIHYHVFKNAGSTVEYILDKSFGECWTRFDGDDPNCVLRPADLLAMLRKNPRLLSLSSHQLRYPVPKMDGHVFFDLVFLRDPIDRIYSIYRHFRRQPAPDDIMSQLSNSLPLGEFISQLLTDYPQYVNDMQVNLLANGGDYTRPPGVWDLDAATDVMRKSAVPGTLDCFNTSWVAAQYFLRPVFPMLDCRYVPQNVFTGADTILEQRLRRVREECGKVIYQQLFELNQLDTELVERTRQEVARRYNLVPDGLRRLQALEIGISQTLPSVG